MSKKTLIRRFDQDVLPSSGLNFVSHSYLFLCSCLDILTKLDDKKVLLDSKEMQIPDLQNKKDQNMRIKKLFHIDLKQNLIYWQVLKKSKRVILKQSFQNRQTLYEWQFNQTSLGANQAIQVLGKWKYLELKKSYFQNKDAFKIIYLNAINNSFLNFEEFYQDIINIINMKLIEVYDGRILQNFVSNMKKQQINEQLWQFVSIEITRIWKKFQEQLKTKKLKENYQTALYKDINKLFNTNSDLKCLQGQTSVPKRQKLTRELSFIENSYKNQNQLLFSNQRKDLSFYTLETQLLFDPQDTSTNQVVIDRSFYKYPYPQNYPFNECYQSQKNEGQKNQQSCRKSLKRPSNKCHQNCICLQSNGEKCPNIERKIQCQHHDCLNSRIRQRKGVLCWYLDEQKNSSQIQNLKQKLNSGLEIRQCHSFGLDFYTVTLIYYLLPFNRIQDGQIVDNEKEKKTIVQILIPYEASKTQNLYLAVKKIASDRQYQKYSYETKILEKKLRWIEKMELQNLKDKFGQQNLTFLKVQQPKCYYKGLGVINSGLKIPKNTLIGEFIGETMPRYRIQQKQQLCAKLIKMKNQIKFYCIDAFTHLDEKSEPRFFSIDPQNKGNFCRNLNHSCEPNCKVDVIVSEGKYILGVYTIREIQQNEELTFDYMSVTDDYQEYMKSVCLCSSLSCRGRYFRYQDQIYTDLDGVFLEKQQPIRKRIKKLIHCSLNFQKKSVSLNTRIEFLKKKQINVSFVPQESKLWLMYWIEVNQKIIARQLQYLHKKNINQSATKLRYSICQKSRVFEPKLGEKQKIATLNAKIEKISHYLNKIKDYSPPFTYKSHQILIKKLQYIVWQSKLREKLSTDSLNIKNFTSQERKIWQLRFNLFEIGSFQLTVKKNIDKAFFYFQQAFTFIFIQIHKYPDYKSEPIKIWRQNLSKYQDTVQYYGKDFYILENLILWAGQLKKIQKNSQKLQKEEKTSLLNQFLKQNQSQFNQTFSQETDYVFKRQFLKKQVQLTVFQIQQEKFKLKLPEQVKRKQSLTFDTDIKKMKKALEKWIERQFLNLKDTQHNFKGAYKIKKIEQKIQQQVKIQSFDQSFQQSCSKKVVSKSQKRKNLKSKKLNQKVKIQA